MWARNAIVDCLYLVPVIVLRMMGPALPVDTEGVPQLVQSLCLVSVPAVNDPPVGLHQHGGAQISEYQHSL